MSYKRDQAESEIWYNRNLNKLPLIVGESNPYGSDPDYALYPSPDGCAGHRLCCKILGMKRAVYMRCFDRVNLCDGPWRIKEARRKADTLRGRQLILLGSKVCHAFGMPFCPWEQIGTVNPWVVLPHPSGLCRLWNQDRAIERARDVVLNAFPGLLGIVGGDDKDYCGERIAEPSHMGYGHNAEED